MEVSWLRRAPGITSSCLAILLGIPGNLLVVCVYRCKSTRTSTHVLICALAAADLLASLLIVFNPLFQRPQYLHEYSVVTKIHIALIDTLQLAGAFLLTGIAFDRYDAICRPHRRLLSVRRARALVGGCVGLWGVLTIITLVLVTPNSSPGDRRACSARLLVVISLPSTLWLCCFVTVVSLYAMVYKTVQKQGKVGASVVDQPRIPNAMTDEAKGDSDARHFGLTANSDAIPSSSLAGSQRNCPGKSLAIQNSRQPTEIHIISGSSDVASRPSGSVRCTTYHGRTSSVERDTGFSAREEHETKPVQHAASSHRLGGGTQFSHHRHQLKDETLEKPHTVRNSRSAYHDVQHPIPANPAGSFAEPFSVTGKLPNADTKKGNRQQAAGKSNGTLRRNCGHRTKMKTTLMLIVSAAVFFITWFPAICAGVWLNVMNCRGTPVPYGSSIVADVLMSFVMANNSANPFIYSLVNGNFRKSCLEILRKTRAKICRCFCRRVI